MFLIPFILSAGLDLSLPEFQPDIDASGNVIVGYVENEDTVIEEIPFVDVSFNTLELDVTGNDSKKSIDISFNDKAPAKSGLSAEPVRSTSIPDGYEAVYLTVETLSNIRASSQAPYSLASNSAGSFYVTLQPGNTYYISTDAPNIKYYTSLTIGSTGSVFTGSSSGTEASLTPNVVTYALVADTRSISAYYLVESSGGDITGNDMSAVVSGLATVNDSINTLNEDVDIAISSFRNEVYSSMLELKNILRAVLLVLLFMFLYPIALNIVKNIVGGDDNV